MKVRTWQQALDLHIDYVKWITSPGVREEIDASLGQEFLERTPLMPDWGEVDPAEVAAAKEDYESCLRLGRGIRIKHGEDELLSCPTFFLSDDLMKLTLAAAQDVPPYSLHLSDLFSPHGLVVFTEPLSEPYHLGAKGVDDDEYPLRAIGWTTIPGDDGHPGAVALHRFVDTDAYEWDEQKGKRPRSPIVNVELPAPWCVGATFSEEWRVDGGYQEIPDAMTAKVASFDRQFLSSLFAIVRQELPAIESPRVPRALAKRTSRQFGPDHEIKVITLRKRKKPWRPEDEEGGVDRVYTHRWLVEGHWRNQYYPSLGGPARLPDGSQDPKNHRPKRIGDYIAGPEHLPLVLKDTVYKVTR